MAGLVNAYRWQSVTACQSKLVGSVITLAVELSQRSLAEIWGVPRAGPCSAALFT